MADIVESECDVCGKKWRQAIKERVGLFLSETGSGWYCGTHRPKILSLDEKEISVQLIHVIDEYFKDNHSMNFITYERMKREIGVPI